MNLEFDEALHLYRVGGAPVVSITQVLQLCGFVDGRWFTPESRVRGVAVHLACEFINEGTLDDSTVSPAILGYVTAYRKFLTDTGFKPVSFERRMFHGIHRFAGTPDLAGGLRGRNSVLDIKTGETGLAAELQTGAQAMLIEENISGFTVMDRYCLRLTKEGKYKLIPHENPGDRVMFLNALAMVNRRINSGELNLEKWIGEQHGDRAN